MTTAEAKVVAKAQKEAAKLKMPIMYTIHGCDACVKLIKKWEAEGAQYVERRAELDQKIMDEARILGSVVPIVVYPDGRVEEGFEGGIGCYIR